MMMIMLILVCSMMLASLFLVLLGLYITKEALEYYERVLKDEQFDK